MVDKQMFKAIGDQVKATIPTPGSAAPNNAQPQVMPAVKQQVPETKPSVPTNLNQSAQPTETAAVPKTVKVKIDGVEKEADETEVLEMGKKFYGLDSHFTRKGQMLAEAERELAKRTADFERRQEQDASKLREVLAERERTDADQRRAQREEEELIRLEQEDPIQAKFVRENRTLQKRIEELNGKVEKTVSDFQNRQLQEDQALQERRNNENVARIRAAADKAKVGFGDIVGYMVEHPEASDPDQIALSITEERRQLVQKMIEEEKAKQNEQAGNAHAQNRVPAGVTGIPRQTPSGEKMPPLNWKNRDKVSKYITDRLADISRDIV